MEKSGNKPHLLSMDSCGAHLTPAVKAAFAECNTVVAVIPGGTTQWLQLLDLVVFAAWLAGCVALSARMAPVDGACAFAHRAAALPFLSLLCCHALSCSKALLYAPHALFEILLAVTVVVRCGRD